MENRRDYELGQARREQIVRVIDLHEREKRQFSRDELIGRDGRSRILPETNALTAVELRDVFTGIELRVQGLIGYLPLTEQLALNLRPRFPVRNLWRMLEESDERYERYLPYFREYGDIGHDPPHLLLVRMFCFFLKEIMTTSLACLYVPEDFEGYFRPKMQFSRTANRFISRGDIINVAGTEFLHSRKLRVNGILKSACVDFLRIIPHLPSWKTERNQVQDALNLLTQVPVTAARPDDMALSMCVPALLRKGYIGALQVYFLYKGYSTMGFAYEAGGLQMPSFLFKLDDIFEQFVRNSLRKVLNKTKLCVLDGNRQRKPIPLYHDNRDFLIKPDAIICQGKRVLAIVEMKYKPKIDESDRYQVISHVLATRAPLGVWVSPADEGSPEGLSYVGALSGGQRFYHYRLDLAGDLDSSQNKMSEDLLKLVLYLSSSEFSARYSCADQPSYAKA